MWTLQIQPESLCFAGFACIKFRFLSFINLSTKNKRIPLYSSRALQTFFPSVFWGFRTASSAEKQIGYLKSSDCENFSKTHLISLYDCVLQHLGSILEEKPTRVYGRQNPLRETKIIIELPSLNEYHFIQLALWI